MVIRNKGKNFFVSFQIILNFVNNYFDEVLKVDQISTEEVRLYRIRFL